MTTTVKDAGMQLLLLISVYAERRGDTVAPAC